MFTALTEDNKRISIEEAASGESYYCPVCRNPVIIKAENSENMRIKEKGFVLIIGNMI